MDKTIIPSVWPGVLPKMLSVQAVSIRVTGEVVFEMFTDTVEDLIGTTKIITPWMKLDITELLNGAMKGLHINIPVFFQSVVFAGVRFNIPDPYVLDVSYRGKEYQHLGDIRLSEMILDVATAILIIFLVGKIPKRTLAKIVKKILLIRRKDQLTRIEQKLKKYHKAEMEVLNKLATGMSTMSNDMNKMSQNIRGDIDALTESVASIDDKIQTLADKQAMQQKANMMILMKRARADAKAMSGVVKSTSHMSKNDAVTEINSVVHLDDAEMRVVAAILGRYRFM